MRGIERPPRWALVALALFLLADLVLVGFVHFRPSSSASTQTTAATSSPAAGASSTTPPAASSAPATPTPRTPTLAVYGDGYSAGNPLGGMGPAAWPAILAARTGAQLTLAAVPQAGYAVAGVDGRTFPQLVTSSPSTADVTVVFGSRNDVSSSPDEVGTAALETFQQIQAQAPATVLLVVGPAWDDAAAPAELEEVRDAVAAAATEVGAEFVDPLAEGWFDRPAGLIATDGISLTDAGHTHVADELTPLVSQVLTSAVPTE